MSAGITWPLPAVATGVGSMPGTDPEEATNIVTGEFAGFPHLVELPARGPGADPIGRTAALLAEVDRSFEVETSPSGWRLGHAGKTQQRRSRTWLAQDIDALEQFAATFVGPVKVQLLGPWTVAAGVADPAGEAVLRDHGAVTDLAAALAEAAAGLVERILRAIPGAQVVVSFDEPSVPDVLEGRVRMSSGRLSHRSVEPTVVEQRLATVFTAVRDRGGIPAIRCARDRAPLDLFVGAGAAAVGIDIGRSLPDEDALPRAWEAGTGLLLGCVPVRGDVAHMGDTAVSEPLRRLMREYGFSHVPDNIAITPSSGLAPLTPDDARSVMSACLRVGHIVRDDMSESVDVQV